jgi:hypothetical protein
MARDRQGDAKDELRMLFDECRKRARSGCALARFLSHRFFPALNGVRIWHYYQ